MQQEPRLPFDLERYIFEFAAFEDPQLIHTLVLVAHRVSAWIEPLRFQVVRLNNSPPAIQFFRLVRNGTKPPAYFAANVKHILLEHMVFRENRDIQRIVRMCTGVTDLGTTYRFNSPAFLDIFGALPRLERLTIDLCALFTFRRTRVRIDPRHAALARVTHLTLHDRIGERETRARVCAALPDMPALTHVRLMLPDLQDGLPELEVLLERLPRLEVMLLSGVQDAREDSPDQEVVRDVRLVVVGGWPSYDKFWAEWEAAARGGDCLWIKAEDFVRRKREGRLDRKEIWLL
ncbi:hypothetical protein MKEN_00968000 [Mycena kentingensis (nom. inval.)]|nr:hypothetical protein MKEN_00968000 [Mycena kentingensis (nom. inval.)]